MTARATRNRTPTQNRRVGCYVYVAPRSKLNVPGGGGSFA